jgi:hypothetical protein
MRKRRHCSWGELNVFLILCKRLPSEAVAFRLPQFKGNAPLTRSKPNRLYGGDRSGGKQSLERALSTAQLRTCRTSADAWRTGECDRGRVKT